MKEVLENKETQEKVLNDQKETLADYNSALRKIKEEYNEIKNDVEHLNSEKIAKLKFLATVLLYNQFDAYKSKESKLRLAWACWKHNIFCEKVVTLSLKEIGELNRMHINKRCTTGVGIINRCMKQSNKKFLRQGLYLIIRSCRRDLMH